MGLDGTCYQSDYTCSPISNEIFIPKQNIYKSRRQKLILCTIPLSIHTIFFFYFILYTLNRIYIMSYPTSVMDLQTGFDGIDQQIVAFTPQHTNPIIACCNCGKPMEANGLAMCPDCIRQSVDITEGIQKSGELTFCKECGKLHNPPSHWLFAPPESRELLAACLRRLKGLNKVRLLDARFIWTEPHSRRIKLKIKVQGEAEGYQNTLVQQSFEVEFVEGTAMCPACAKSYTANTWVASVQVRQKVAHKRTFFYLEQLILKNHAHKDTVSIEEDKEGLNFFYNERKHALKMVDFLSGIVPVKSKSSEEFISEDSHTSKKTFKFTFFVEIVPVCKDDLVVLPKRVARSLGFQNRLVLCNKIANTVHFLDPLTLKTGELTASNYWRTPFDSLATSKTVTEFMVLDVEPLGPGYGNLQLADITVARSSDLGVNDTTYYVRSHLGRILHPGDNVLGYYLVNTNFNHELWDSLDHDRVPEVVLLKKSFPVTAKRNKGRNWKLKRMANEYNERQVHEDTLLQQQGKRKDDSTADRQNRDYEEFLQELEEDPELRTEVDLYRRFVDPAENDNADEDDEDDDADLPEIDLEELKIDDGEDDDELDNVVKDQEEVTETKKSTK